MIEAHTAHLGEHVRTATLEVRTGSTAVLATSVSTTVIRTGELMRALVCQSTTETASAQSVKATTELDGRQRDLTLDVIGPLPHDERAPSILLSVAATSRESFSGIIEDFDAERHSIFVLMTYGQADDLDLQDYDIVPYVAIVDTPALIAQGYDPIPLAIGAIIARQYAYRINRPS